MSDKIQFTPVRGKEKDILDMPQKNGYVYFTTDSGRIYIDTTNQNKVIIGGNGVSLFYGNDSSPKQDPLIDEVFSLVKNTVENYSNCKVNDLILNQADGCFYKIESISEDSFSCTRLSVSGSGGTGKSNRGSVKVKNNGESNVLNGDSVSVTITVNAMTTLNADNVLEPVQEQMKAIITLAAKNSITDTYTTYYTKTITVEHGVPFVFDATSFLQDSTETKITCAVTEIDEENLFTVSSNSVIVTTHALSIAWNTSVFDSLKYFESGNIEVSCEITSGVDRILDIYFDDYLVFVGKYDASNSSSTISQNITANSMILNEDGSSTGFSIADVFTHGNHIISAELSLSKAGDVRGNSTGKIYKEIALKINDDMPLIWVGDYQDSYYEYDTILLPYRVYIPGSSENIEVHLSKNGVEIEGSPREIKANSVEWSYWEISNLSVNDSSYYTIRIGKDEQETKRNFTFTVLEDPRQMGLISGATATFDSKGRSNSESAIKRETLLVADQKATFNNFNWYNNGWVFDSNQTTCLRISNGASITIPIGSNMIFQGGGDKTDKHTIEFQFKIKNVQDYSKLITNYTRYTTSDSASVRNWDDSKAFAAFKEAKAKGEWTNYDAYLANYYLQQEGTPDYDELEYKSTEKTFDFNNVACTFAARDESGALSDLNPGIYIGPADAFFTNGINSVTVDFIEDELINLAFVFTGGSSKTGGDRLMEIYLNGILTSIARSTLSDQWEISSSEIVFTSNTCDIDLYKVRTYDKALLAPEIIQNYAFDLKDTTIWDQKDLCVMNNDINEYTFSYQKMLDYNEQNPSAPLMPYIILYTTKTNSSNRLPYNKSKEAVKGTMEFVNTALDAAYANGSLSKLAEEAGMTVNDYYIHHCPSWISKDNAVSFSVQGTSSQFYPRRNFKAKTKGEMYNNRGPFALDYTNEEKKESTKCSTFYFDNDTVGTDKFTLKIDYMESSGDYNRGFANLVATTYSKHPIEDYENVFNNYDKFGDPDDYRTSVQGFPVLAFHWPDDLKEPIFIGKYNMLTDKGSAEVYGFKPDKIITSKTLNDAKVRDIVECWEFENNSRGFCSFRDPWNRKELSFKAPEGSTDEFTSANAPIVADSFEYRYSANDDVLDLLYDLSSLTQTNQDTIVKSFVNTAPDKIKIETEENVKEDGTVETTSKIINSLNKEVDVVNAPETGQQLMLDLYSNWEKAVAWVWSTCTDANIDGLGLIPSIGEYKAIDLAEELYQKNTYYLQDSNGDYILCADSTFDSDNIYYTPSDDEYRIIILTDDKNKVYKVSTYYTKSEQDIYTLTDDAFNQSETYYQLIEEEDKIDSAWDLPSPVTYGGKTYTKDTKEYRQAKFINELSDHFDKEYLATYFLMTEVFECYDSRGKNAMFASWGPQEVGGNYIWYPIFYDIDTQLGINNTGIPSFEYYVDATEDGTFSTNDSVLWNNFYYYFKGLIVDKYKQLSGIQSSNFGSIPNALFEKDLNGKKTSTVESWYQSDPDVSGSYAMMGERPLLAYNMDEYFKYITPTNASAKNTYYGRLTDSGVFSQEDDTYFYALQGDRHLYRQQFLTNRLEYIDSWLTLDNYARGGDNRIRSRVSANNPTNTSDKWIAGTATNGATGLITNEPYWKDEANRIKTHEFDGEYWITMTPIRNSYVTVGTDAANFPSQKYSGTPIRFETSDLKNGVMNSGNYREQLYYIYGLNQMKSLGDLSKLYLQEFELTGSATKMTDLLLGYDGIVNEDGDGNQNQKYKNSDVNSWTIPASSSKGDGMPLLKEVNLSNILFKDSAITFDFSSCEKLENFRNTGSNITAVTFADGVALNTLYLTSNTKSLNLTEARLLKNLVETYEAPIKNTITEKLEVKEKNQGLYIEGLTDKDNDSVSTDITTLNIVGGNLDYNSYKLLEKYYYAAKKNTGINRKINLTDVQWSPYTLIEDTESDYDSTLSYYKDNGHFGLEPYEFTGSSQWEIDLNNKVVYLYDEDVSGIQFNDNHEVINITDITLLKALADASYLQNLTDGKGSVPNLTGIIYINNDEEYDEGDIQNELQDKYPNMTFFFKTVKKGYSARFIIQQNNIQTVVGTAKLPSSADIATTFFAKPSYSLSDLKDYMPNYNFLGWATDPEGTDMIITWTNPGPDYGTTITQKEETDNWSSQRLIEGQSDYTYYAIYSIKQYVARFYSADGIDYYDEIINDGDLLYAPTSYIPTKDDSALDLDKTYAHIGWRKLGLNESATNVVGTATNLDNGLALSGYTRFGSLFKEASVYENILDSKYFDVTSYAYTEVISQGGDMSWNLDGYQLSPKSGVTLSGKITIPATINNKPIVSISGFSTMPITHVFFESGSELRQISSQTFQRCTSLKYIDFTLASLRELGSSAFVQAPLEVYVLPENLYSIGQNCFNQAFYSAGIETIVVGSKVSCISTYAFSNMGIYEGSDMIIGNSTNGSKLNFSYNSNPNASSAYLRLRNNKGSSGYGFGTVYFYSSIYSSGDENAYEYKNTMYSVRQCLGYGDDGYTKDVQVIKV